MKTRLTLTMACSLIFYFSHAQEAFNATKEEIKEIEVFNGVNTDVYTLKELTPQKVVVSSTLPHKNDIYTRENLTDNDPGTAWVEGREGDGKGDQIVFFFSGHTPPDVIVITPGYYKDDATWYKNNRVSKITIRMYQSEEGADGDGLLDVIEVDLATEDGKITPGKQYIDLSNLYLQNMGYTEFEICEIMITGVDSKDAKYDDTCISEVQFLVQDERVKTKE